MTGDQVALLRLANAISAGLEEQNGSATMIALNLENSSVVIESHSPWLMVLVEYPMPWAKSRSKPRWESTKRRSSAAAFAARAAAIRLKAENFMMVEVQVIGIKERWPLKRVKCRIRSSFPKKSDCLKRLREESEKSV